MRTLTQRVASCAQERERWLKAHPNLLVARRVRRSDLPAANRRKQALAWLGHLSPRPRLVQDGFLSLGYPDLETACEEAGGFISLHEPDPIEQRYVAVLNEIVLAAYPGTLPKEGPPPLRIIVNASAAWKGMADHVHAPAGVSTAGGGRIRYRQTYVALDKRLLAPDRFGDALATYLHELAHVFGGERSVAFSSALTDLIAQTADEAESLVVAKHQWSEIGRDGS